METIIERATINDADSLIDVQNQSFLSDFQKYGICPSYNQTKEKIASHIISDNVYKIIADSRIIGDIVIIKKAGEHYHLQCICVVPKYENGGIGNTAMRFIEREFPEAILWTLVTPSDKLRNHYFYQKHGFQITREFFTEDVRMSYFEKTIVPTV